MNRLHKRGLFIFITTEYAAVRIYCSQSMQLSECGALCGVISSKSIADALLEQANCLIEAECHYAQYQDGRDHHIQLKGLAAVNDQVSESSSGGKKFSDNHTYQCQTDIYLGSTEDYRNGIRKYNFEKGVSFGTV